MYKKVLVNQLDSSESKEQNEDKILNIEDGSLWRDKVSVNNKYIEYGDKRAEIIDFAVIDKNGFLTSSIQKNTKFKIKMKVIFHEDIAEPIFAFTVKDVKGTDITGTNTMYEKVYVSAKAGDVKIVTFTQNMNLQGGEYLISLGCTGYNANDFVVYHRLYDVVNVSVISDKNTVGYYDMNSAIEVE